MCQMTARRSSLLPSLPGLFFLFVCLPRPQFCSPSPKNKSWGEPKIRICPKTPPSRCLLVGTEGVGALSPPPGLEGFVVAALLSPFLLPFSWHFSLFGLFFAFLLGK